MPIPENQLATWSHPGATESSKRTHKAVRRALRDWDDIRSREYEVYLQGSYKNSTNIYGNSDVDVIAQINDTFFWDGSDLSEGERNAHHKAYPDAQYRLEDFRDDVLSALRAYFGVSSVIEGNKAIKIAPNSRGNPLPADVLVCAQHRKYSYFRSPQDFAMAEGIRFVTQDGQTITNYPKPHYENGVRKNNQCRSSYKAGVRILKHARDKLIRLGWLPSSVVPSYFLECFAYNAASYCYSGTWQSVYHDVVSDLGDSSRYPEYMCQNGVRGLFGKDDDQWNMAGATLLVENLERLWREWR